MTDQLCKRQLAAAAANGLQWPHIMTKNKHRESTERPWRLTPANAEAAGVHTESARPGAAHLQTRIRAQIVTDAGNW